MKIGFAGKGGAGKTTISSLIINKLKEKYSILAIDADSNVNLANSLGINNTSDLIAFGNKKNEIMEYTGSTKIENWEERVYLPKETDGFYGYNHDFINRYSIKKENYKVMSLGFIDDDKRGIESMCDYYEMCKVFLNHINLKNDEILIADLAAGVEMISRATIMSFDLIFVITDANFKNIKVANQILKGLDLIEFKPDEIIIIPNKYLDMEDKGNIIQHFNGYHIIDGIQFSEEIYDLDSKKSLTSEKIKDLDLAISSICDFIIHFKNNYKKDKKYIYNRIKFLDEKKEKFLKSPII